jgi:hypothetical protein
MNSLYLSNRFVPSVTKPSIHWQQATSGLFNLDRSNARSPQTWGRGPARQGLCANSTHLYPTLQEMIDRHPQRSDRYVRSDTSKRCDSVAPFRTGLTFDRMIYSLCGRIRTSETSCFRSPLRSSQSRSKQTRNLSSQARRLPDTKPFC